MSVIVAEDRTILVPAGSLVRTGYVKIHRIRLANKTRIGVGDVDVAFRRRLQLGDYQPWPPPVGYWETDPDGGRNFVILDGRHEFIATLMLGFETIFVAWIDENPD